MWAVNGSDLIMAKGDYGVALPCELKGMTLDVQDSIRFTFNKGAENILVKEYSNIIDNTVRLEFTEQESAKFSIGTYNYSVDWYQDGSFMDNIVPEALFKVVKKVEVNH